MPKKIKAIPDERAEWTFGDALYWHFFIHGTRPEGSPDDATGQTWNPKEAAGAVNVTIRAFWNWIDDRHQPYDSAAIERALFGDNRRFAEARNELRRLLQEARERQRKSASGGMGTQLPAVPAGQLVTVHTTPFEASEVDGPLTEADLRGIAPAAPENFGKTGRSSFDDGARTSGASLPGGIAAGPQGSSRTPRASRKTVTVVIGGS